MKRLVIFGAGDIAQLAHFYFTRDAGYEVVAFTVDAPYLQSESFCGAPVIAFDRVAESFPPSTHEMFIAVSYTKLNALRREKYLAAKAMGYVLATYVSSRATVLNEGRIGDNCFILEDNTVQPFARIGSNVTLWSGNHVGHHSEIDDHCFVASHVVISGGVKIGESCFVGVNVTLRDHVSVGAGSVIGAGALVLSDVPPDSVMSPAATEVSRVPASRLRRI